MTTVWRQGAVRASGPGVGSRPNPVLYERFLHNPGWGARLDAPMMSQVNDDWDTLDTNGDPVTPNWDRTRTFVQDRFGNVIAVMDNGLQRAEVRISYDQLGYPVLDSDYRGADYDENGGIDGADLGAFFADYEEGHPAADLDQNGGIDGTDLALFFQWYGAGFEGDHDLNDQRFLYRGYWWDDKLEMYHVRHRVYDPRRMIWLQRDPLGQLAGPDEYAYCEGEPRDLDDPMGLLPRAELNERDHVYDANGNIQYGYSISYHERDRFLFVLTSEERYLGKKFYPYADPRQPYPNSDTDAYSMQLAKDIAWGADIAGDMHDGVRDGAKVVGTAAMIIVPGPDDAVLAALFSRNALKGIKIVGGKIFGITKKGVEVVVEATEKEALAIKLALQKAEKVEEAGVDATKAANAAEETKDAGKAGNAPTKGEGCPERPKRVTNEKHHPNSKSPEPKNVEELYERSIADKEGRRWAMDDDGTIHRFSAPRNGETHWNGSGFDRSDLNKEVYRELVQQWKSRK